MELKETNHLLSSVDINVVRPSERDNSDRRSTYDMFLTAEKDEANDINNRKTFDVDNAERKFGNVSTLDWLQTWRSTKVG